MCALSVLFKSYVYVYISFLSSLIIYKKIKLFIFIASKVKNGNHYKSVKLCNYAIMQLFHFTIYFIIISLYCFCYHYK